MKNSFFLKSPLSMVAKGLGTLGLLGMVTTQSFAAEYASMKNFLAGMQMVSNNQDHFKENLDETKAHVSTNTKKVEALEAGQSITPAKVKKMINDQIAVYMKKHPRKSYKSNATYSKALKDRLAGMEADIKDNYKTGTAHEARLESLDYLQGIIWNGLHFPKMRDSNNWTLGELFTEKQFNVIRPTVAVVIWNKGQIYQNKPNTFVWIERVQDIYSKDKKLPRGYVYMEDIRPGMELVPAIKGIAKSFDRKGDLTVKSSFKKQDVQVLWCFPEDKVNEARRFMNLLNGDNLSQRSAAEINEFFGEQQADPIVNVREEKRAEARKNKQETFREKAEAKRARLAKFNW